MSEEELATIQKLIEETLVKSVPEAIEPAIKKYVNGKIDRLDEKLTNHMTEVEPYLKAGEALKLGKGLVKWIVGTLIAFGSLVLLVKQIFFPS